MFKKRFLPVLAITVTAVVFSAWLGVTGAQAVVNTDTAKADAAAAKAELKAKVCEILRTHWSIVISRYENNKERHLNLFTDLRTRLSNIVTKLDAKGIDTSELKADLVILDQKIEKFRTDFAAYTAKVAQAGTVLCDDTTTPLKAALKSSRDLLATVRKDVQDIRQYYQTVIRKDIQTLRDEFKALKKPSLNGNDNAAGNRDDNASTTATSTDQD